MITMGEAQVKFTESFGTQWSNGKVYTSGSTIMESVGQVRLSTPVFKVVRKLCKRPLNSSTIFVPEATTITPALDFFRGKDTVQRDKVVYPDQMAIEGESIVYSLICHIMNLLWPLSDKGTGVRSFCMPSNCGMEGNELNLLQLTLGPSRYAQYLTDAEGVEITWHRTGHTKASNHIACPGDPINLQPLWSNTDSWPNTPQVCRVAWQSWRILKSLFIEDLIWGALHDRVSEKKWVLLTDTKRQISNTILYLNQSPDDESLDFNWYPLPDRTIRLDNFTLIFVCYVLYACDR